MQQFVNLSRISSTGTVTFKKPWKGCPDSRGSHSGSLIGNSLVVFGGYGGPGFSRRDFNDVHVSWSVVIRATSRIRCAPPCDTIRIAQGTGLKVACITGSVFAGTP